MAQGLKVNTERYNYMITLPSLVQWSRVFSGILRTPFPINYPTPRAFLFAVKPAQTAVNSG